MRAETWFSADEAVEAGLADTVQGKSTETKNSWDLSIYSYAGRAQAPDPVLPTPDPYDTDSVVADLERAFA
jgi:hypothetical protein